MLRVLKISLFKLASLLACYPSSAFSAPLYMQRSDCCLLLFYTCTSKRLKINNSNNNNNRNTAKWQQRTFMATALLEIFTVEIFFLTFNRKKTTRTQQEMHVKADYV